MQGISPETAVVMILLAIWLIIQTIQTNRMFSKHWKLLNWFAKNVHWRKGEMPGDAPKELLDLVGEEEASNPDK